MENEITFNVHLELLFCFPLFFLFGSSCVLIDSLCKGAYFVSFSPTQSVANELTNHS